MTCPGHIRARHLAPGRGKQGQKGAGPVHHERSARRGMQRVVDTNMMSFFEYEMAQAYLAIGTEVSAKYKGAFCEARVRKVDKEVKKELMLMGTNEQLKKIPKSNVCILCLFSHSNHFRKREYDAIHAFTLYNPSTKYRNLEEK